MRARFLVPFVWGYLSAGVSVLISAFLSGASPTTGLGILAVAVPTLVLIGVYSLGKAAGRKRIDAERSSDD